MKTVQLVLVLVISLLGSTAFVFTSEAEEATTVVVLAMHGGIPSDFPGSELKKYFKLHRQVHAKEANAEHQHDEAQQNASIHEQLHRLEHKLRNWPRNEENDPYYWGSQKLRKALAELLEYPVLLSFNEFCAPAIEDAIQAGVEQYHANRIIVVTPMLTQGGSHSERDIPEAIERAKEQLGNPNLTITYIWPVPEVEVARLLTKQIHNQLTIE